MREIKSHRSAGFTIVELLIVIVVIAILAAISVVAYNGIQNRANDTAIKNDLTNFAKKVQLVAVEDGTFPEGGGISLNGTVTGNSRNFANFSFNPSKQSYFSSSVNLYYCTGKKADKNTFIVSARSSSGTIYLYSPESAVIQPAEGTGSVASHCRNGFDDGNYTFSYGYNPNTTIKWADWIK